MKIETIAETSTHICITWQVSYQCNLLQIHFLGPHFLSGLSHEPLLAIEYHGNMTLVGSDVAEDISLEDTTIIDVENNEDEDEMIEDKPNPVPLNSPTRSDDNEEDDLDDTSEAAFEDISNLEDCRTSSPTLESTPMPPANCPPKSESSLVIESKCAASKWMVG